MAVVIELTKCSVLSKSSTIEMSVIVLASFCTQVISFPAHFISWYCDLNCQKILDLLSLIGMKQLYQCSYKTGVDFFIRFWILSSLLLFDSKNLLQYERH